MEPKRAVAAFFLSQMLAAAAFAQGAPAEFGRVSGGVIDLMTKHSRPLSGSLAINTGKGYGATLGGTVVPDRMWFFASMEKRPASFASQYTGATDVKMNALIGDRQSLAASFATARQSGLTTGTTLGAPVPSSFLSLHYTGIVSNNMFVTTTFSKLQRSNPPD